MTYSIFLFDFGGRRFWDRSHFIRIVNRFLFCEGMLHGVFVGRCEGHRWLLSVAGT